MNNKNPISEATNLSGQDSGFPQSSPAPHSNPFTGDMKGGEFTSDFGTNTNAVSQIFKGGGFGTSEKGKYIIIGVIVLAIAIGGAFLLFDSGDSTESADGGDGTEEVGDAATGDQATTDGTEAAKEDGSAATTDQAATDQAAGQTATDSAVAEAPAAAPTAGTHAGATGSLAIGQPNDGASHDYDETQGPAVFEWTGSADRIVFSRHANMNPVERSVSLKGKTNYQFDHPYPGTWFWKIENSEGASEVRRFVVNPPARRNFPVSQPTSGSSLSGNGGVVSWQGDSKVAWYAVQLVTPGASWATPQYRFGTSGTSIALQGVTAGSYDMRVGAFSEVSGRWEWQEIKGVTVQ